MRNYNDHHQSKELVHLPDNCPVSGTIASSVPESRSSNFNVQSGQLSRSQQRGNNATVPKTRTGVSLPQRMQTQSQSGITLQPLLRYKI